MCHNSLIVFPVLVEDISRILTHLECASTMIEVPKIDQHINYEAKTMVWMAKSKGTMGQ